MSNAPTMTPENVWKITLGELELQMAKSTFNTHLKDARLVSGDDDVFVVKLRSQNTLKWVEHSLRDTIKRTLSSIAGHEVEPRFVVDGDNDVISPNSNPAASNGRVSRSEETEEQASPPAPPEPPYLNGSGRKIGQDGYGGNLSQKQREELLSRIHQRDKKKKGGDSVKGEAKEETDDPPVNFRNIRRPTDPLGSYVKTTHYALRFWRPLIGPDVFDLLQIISSYAYEFETLQKDPPNLKKLARKYARGDWSTLKGRKASGPNPAKVGLLDRLREHRLCNYRAEGVRRGQRHFFDYLTKMEDLPLLTPKQVAQLDPEDQLEHLEWLDLHTAVDLETWLRDERETAIAPFPEEDRPGS